MIRTFDYRSSLGEIEDEIRAALDRVLRSGRLILGPETEAFEQEFAAFTGSRFCVGVTSGTTALHLALAALDVGAGDEVITVANTCPPTISAIRLTGAVPVFVDVRADDLMMDADQIESRLSERTRCIVPVHLWGKSADLDSLEAVSKKHGIPIIEDCAQAHGTTWNARHVGTFGRMGCFSFYPTKNIGAYGDAGAIVTDDPDLDQRLRRLRMYGYEGSQVSLENGINGRISEMQSAILRTKLRIYPQWLARRLAVAAVYDAEITHPSVRKPSHGTSCRPSYHQYVIESDARNQLAGHLRERDIETGIHYAVPIHKMPAYRDLPGSRAALPITEAACERILSLPIHESLSPESARVVSDAINSFPS